MILKSQGLTRVAEVTKARSPVPASDLPMSVSNIMGGADE